MKILNAEWITAVLAGAVATVLLVAASAQEQDTAETPGLTEEELALDAPAEDFNRPQEPISASEADDIVIKPLAENGGYFDEQGRYVVDLMQQDSMYLAIQIETPDGRPIEDAEPEFSIEGTSRLLAPEEIGMQTTTDEYGIVDFAVAGGDMGVDRVKVSYDGESTEILVNVISLEALSYATPLTGEGFLAWSDLMQAQVRYEDMTLFAEIPAAVSERSGETVKLSGFMMPLEAGVKQEWFLLTTHPPGCFFHVPGGPSGAVEVFAAEGIEVSWNPIVLEGRFEALEESDSAVYQLHDARLAEQ